MNNIYTINRINLREAGCKYSIDSPLSACFTFTALCHSDEHQNLARGIIIEDDKGGAKNTIRKFMLCEVKELMNNLLNGKQNKHSFLLK